MDDKNLYPAMIGKLREMLADSTVQIAAPEVAVANPAFDVTHNRFVTGIITERGIVKPTDLTAVFADLLPKA